MKHFLFLQLYDDGINDRITLSGESINDAIKQRILKNEPICGLTMTKACEDMDLEFLEPSEEDLDRIVNWILKTIDNSYIDGDSAARIEVLDISDPYNVRMAAFDYPNEELDINDQGFDHISSGMEDRTGNRSYYRS